MRMKKLSGFGHCGGRKSGNKIVPGMTKCQRELRVLGIRIGPSFFLKWNVCRIFHIMRVG